MEEWERIAEEFCCSETMRHDLKQCLIYATVSGIDMSDILEKMHTTGELPCRDKKAGKEILNEFRKRVTAAVCEDKVFDEKRENTLDTSVIYVEKSVRNHPRTEEILLRFPDAEILKIASYKDVYYHPDSNTDNNAKIHMILAEKRGNGIIPGAPVCQDFDERYFYYTSCSTGCVYDCEYCYLKGMYPSRDLLIYVNIEDIFAETEKMLESHKVYLCLSYDTDLFALESITGYTGLWSTFVRSHPGLLAECRTKCARTDLWESIEPCERMIFAFTLSPDEVIGRFEHRTPSLAARIACIREAMERGFTVRLCFDPMLRIPGWREAYARMVRLVSEELDLNRVRDISVGTFRISKDYIKRLRRVEPDSAAVQYPFVNEAGVYGYPQAQRNEMTEFMIRELKEKTPGIRVYSL